MINGITNFRLKVSQNFSSLSNPELFFPVTSISKSTMKIKLSNLLTVLLKEIANSSKNINICGRWRYLRKMVFLRHRYFSAECPTGLGFKIFKSFSYDSIFNKFTQSPLLSLSLRFLIS